MLQLNPQEQFVVVRQIGNHNDTETYFVRAVIRNAKTDALIDTLDLEDRGDYRFAKTWLVPKDSSGNGFWISIVTSVYTTDSYDTKAENYSDEETTYLVQERYIFNPNYPIPTGGSDINYKKIREIVSEEVQKQVNGVVKAIPKTPKIIEVTKEVSVASPGTPVDLTPILGETKAIKDLIIRKIETLVQSFDRKNESIVDDLKTSISGLADQLEMIKEEIDESIEEASSLEKLEETKKSIVDLIKQLEDGIKNISVNLTMEDLKLKLGSDQPKKTLLDERAKKLLKI